MGGRSMNASGMMDPATVRRFIEVIHDHAARATSGVEKPGVLQLVRIHPTGGAAVTTRFAIGQIERMVEAAIADASAGFNVYIETRTVPESTKKRGEVADTRAVFAF